MSQNRSRTEYSIINMLAGIVGYIINTLFGFICRVIFVRTLSADYLGVNGLFTNILAVLSLAELGIGSAIIYALYKPIAENNKEKIASIMQFYRKAYAFIGIIVAAAGLAIMPFLKYITKNPPAIRENLYFLYLLYLFSTVSSYFFSYRASLLTAMQRQYIVSGYNYVVTIVQSGLQIIYLLVTHEYIGYLIIQTVGGIIYNIWISRKAAKDYPYITAKKVKPLPKDEKRSLFTNIKALAISKVAGVLVNSTDNIAISMFKGLASVGYASNYTILSNMLGGIVGLVFNALPGSVGNYNATADDDGKYKFFKVLNLANFWLFGWISLGMIFVSTDLVNLLYGQEYTMPFQIPFIIALNQFSIGMIQAVYVYQSTLGLFKYGQYLLFLTGFINLVLDVILGRLLGVFGIFLATLIARACTTLWYLPNAVFKYGLHKSPWLYWKRYLHFALVLIVTGIACGGLCQLCRFSVAINVFAKFIICCIVPNLFFYLAFGKSEEFTYVIQNLGAIVDKIKHHRKKV